MLYRVDLALDYVSFRKRDDPCAGEAIYRIGTVEE